MEHRTSEYNEYTVLHLEGELDLAAAPELRKIILALIEKHDAIMIDLTDVSYIDSSGIACFVEAYQNSRRESKTFTLANVSDFVMKVLSLARLNNIFNIEQVDF